MRLYIFDDYRLGVLGSDGRMADVTDALPEHVKPPERMTAAISLWHRLGDVIRARSERPGAFELEDVSLRAPQPQPKKIVAAPVNYKRHQEEMGGTNGVYVGADIKTIETYAGFIKASSSIVGPDGVIELPIPGRRVDHEAELGVVIGRRASRVSRDDALDYVFGYMPLLDITVRGEEDRSYRKSFDTFTPIGPAIVTADEVGDPGSLELTLTVNGELRQAANTADLIYGVPRLIELYSNAMTLEPGDVIATGTPEGVGPIEDGDEIILTVESVGTLTMKVVDRA